MQATIDLIKSLSLADGAPGFEDEVRAIIRERLEPHGRIDVDAMGNLICEKNGAAGGPRVLIDCHMDEIGFMVQHITAEGFLKFVTLGGVWPHLLLGKRVNVCTPKGKIEGVITAAPPRDTTEVAKIEDMAIDVGAASREEAESWGLRVGLPAVPISHFRPMTADRMLMGKAFDNRVGCALAVEIMERIENNPNTLVVTASAQEELGGRGARVSVNSAAPDVAIVLEGPPADDYFMMNRGESQGRLGEGVQIRLYDPSTVINPRLGDLAIGSAMKLGIRHQLAVKRFGGTDASAIQSFGRGIPAIVLGVPVRYAHAPHGMIHLDDFEAARELAIAMIERLDAGAVERLGGKAACGEGGGG